MLARINIKVDLKTIPKAQYWPEFDKRSADIMMIGWHSDTEDTNNFLSSCRHVLIQKLVWGNTTVATTATLLLIK